MVIATGILIGLLLGGAVVFLVLRSAAGARATSTNKTRDELLAEATRQAETIQREAHIEAREQAVKVRADLERELNDQRARLQKSEERLLSREDELERKQTEIERREQGVADREAHAKQLQLELKEANEREMHLLESIAGMTVGEAKATLLERSEELIRHELARRVRQHEEEAQAEARRRARNLVADALQRVAASHAAETTASVIELPSDDMKGRIIGREGRNIRTLEKPDRRGRDRRRHARRRSCSRPSTASAARSPSSSLERLIEDGRIHPARIEEVVRPGEGGDRRAHARGRRAGRLRGELRRVHEEIIELLGRLHYRTSYGQNVLQAHARGGPPRRPDGRRAGCEREGWPSARRCCTTSARRSRTRSRARTRPSRRQYAKRYGESAAVVHAIEAHHYEIAAADRSRRCC